MIIYPTILEKSYIWNLKEKSKFKNSILKKIKRKKLPKDLEISFAKSLLEDLEKMPEHDYSNKYDTFCSQHMFFY